MGTDIAIDVGTSRTRISIPGKGVVVDEASFVVKDLQTDQIIAFGNEAYDMLGKTSKRFNVMCPLSSGVVSDFDAVQEMILFFLSKVEQGKLTMPRVVACIPSEITEVEKRAIVNSISATGVRKVFLIEDPVAAAIGSGIQIDSPHGFFIVDIGGGTTDMAIITLSGIASSRSIKIGGNSLDDELIKYLKSNYNLIVGKRTAENVKMEVGCVVDMPQEKVFRAKGRDFITGMPKWADVSSKEVKDILSAQLKKIILNIKEVMEDTSPELVGDILLDGIHLSGGGAKLFGMQKLIEDYTGLKVTIAQDPESAVIRGASESVKKINELLNKPYGAMNPLSDEY